MRCVTSLAALLGWALLAPSAAAVPPPPTAPDAEEAAPERPRAPLAGRPDRGDPDPPPMQGPIGEIWHHELRDYPRLWPETNGLATEDDQRRQPEPD